MWSLKHLAENPRVQHELRRELMSVVPRARGDVFTFDDMQSGLLPYLDAVVEEGLRIARVRLRAFCAIWSLPLLIEIHLSYSGRRAVIL